jgi:hypothetical protein
MYLVRISVVIQTILTESFRDIPQSLEENAGLLPYTRPHLSLPHPLEFIGIQSHDATSLQPEILNSVVT